MNIDKKLTPDEQSQILEALLGFQIDDGVILDDDGEEFYGNTRNRDVDLTTLRGICMYIRNREYERGQQHGAAKVQRRIKTALGID